MRRLIRWLCVALMVVSVGVLVYATDYDRRCHAKGGNVENRFDGYQHTPERVPMYSQHCWVGNEEVPI